MAVALLHPEPSTVATLAGWPARPTVSVYLPLSPAGANPDTVTRLRRAAQTARETLVEQFGLDPAEAAAIAAPLAEQDPPFATSAAAGAWFLSDGRQLAVSLPDAVEPAVVVGLGPDLLGLVPFLASGPEFYALAFSQKRARLFRGDRYSLAADTETDLPQGVADALRFSEREPQLARKGTGAMYGGGGGEDLHKDEFRRYAHALDRALRPILNGSTAPLVVLGVEYEAAIFADESKHPVVLTVAGNADHLESAAVHERAWPAVAALAGPADAASAKVRELAGTGKVALDPAEIQRAAVSGTVSEVVVGRSATGGLTGDFTRQEVATAVQAALAARATVHVVEDAALPPSCVVAAVLRY